MLSLTDLSLLSALTSSDLTKEASGIESLDLANMKRAIPDTAFRRAGEKFTSGMGRFGGKGRMIAGLAGLTGLTGLGYGAVRSINGEESPVAQGLDSLTSQGVDAVKDFGAEAGDYLSENKGTLGGTAIGGGMGYGLGKLLGGSDSNIIPLITSLLGAYGGNALGSQFNDPEALQGLLGRLGIKSASVAEYGTVDALNDNAGMITGGLAGSTLGFALAREMLKSPFVRKNPQTIAALMGGSMLGLGSVGALGGSMYDPSVISNEQMAELQGAEATTSDKIEDNLSSIAGALAGTVGGSMVGHGMSNRFTSNRDKILRTLVGGGVGGVGGYAFGKLFDPVKIKGDQKLILQELIGKSASTLRLLSSYVPGEGITKESAAGMQNTTGTSGPREKDVSWNPKKSDPRFDLSEANNNGGMMNPFQYMNAVAENGRHKLWGRGQAHNIRSPMQYLQDGASNHATSFRNMFTGDENDKPLNTNLDQAGMESQAYKGTSGMSLPTNTDSQKDYLKELSGRWTANGGNMNGMTEQEATIMQRFLDAARQGPTPSDVDPYNIMLGPGARSAEFPNGQKWGPGGFNQHMQGANKEASTLSLLLA